MSNIQNLMTAILEGDENKTKLLVLEAINKGEKASEVMNKGMIAAMDIVGEKMESEEMFIPEVLMSAKAMSSGVEILRPHLKDDDVVNQGVAVIGSVHGDLHDIGKNLVKMLLEGAGFKVIDLGTNVESKAFLSAVQDHNANIVGMSALLTTTMPMMKEVIDLLSENNLRENVKVLVGGAPVTEEYSQKIGADGYGADAGSAVRIAKSMMQQ
jgi:5-methyltetrahydrofolate--homocysteine methyltransferase